MPQLFGMEPDKYKPLLFMGGGILLLFIIFRNRGQSSGEVAASPPLADVPPMAVSAPSLVPEMSDTQRAAEALQLQKAEQEMRFEEASNALHLKAQGMQLRAFQGQMELEEAAAQRQVDAIRSKPMSCPHGYEVRLGPDGKPYCRSTSGATNLRNVVIKPAEGAVKEAVHDYVRYGLENL